MFLALEGSGYVRLSPPSDGFGAAGHDGCRDCVSGNPFPGRAILPLLSRRPGESHLNFRGIRGMAHPANAPEN